MLVIASSSLTTDTPSPLSGVMTEGSRSGVLTTAIAGEERPDQAWDEHLRAACRGLLDALAAVPLAEPGCLDRPRTWCGGQEWPAIVREGLYPLLPADAVAAADDTVDEVIELGLGPEGDRGLVHGDFGRHNILWQGGAVSGLIDLDHACIGDRGMDLAPLVVFHGAAAVENAFGPALTRRTIAHAASLSLQVAAAAKLVGATALRDHALGNFVRRHPATHARQRHRRINGSRREPTSAPLARRPQQCVRARSAHPRQPRTSSRVPFTCHYPTLTCTHQDVYAHPPPFRRSRVPLPTHRQENF